MAKRRMTTTNRIATHIIIVIMSTSMIILVRRRSRISASSRCGARDVRKVGLKMMWENWVLK